MSGRDIKDFLLARIAEDEVTARAAWHDQMSVPVGATVWHQSTMPHVARHNPARVLAECEAKRAIIDIFADRCPEVYDGERWVSPLAALAAVYKDHPDYRKEWSLGD